MAWKKSDLRRHSIHDLRNRNRCFLGTATVRFCPVSGYERHYVKSGWVSPDLADRSLHRSAKHNPHSPRANPHEEPRFQSDRRTRRRPLLPLPNGCRTFRKTSAWLDFFDHTRGIESVWAEHPAQAQLFERHGPIFPHCVRVMQLLLGPLLNFLNFPLPIPARAPGLPDRASRADS